MIKTTKNGLIYRIGEEYEYEEYRCDSYAVIAQRNGNAEWHVYVAYKDELRWVAGSASKERACEAALSIALFAEAFSQRKIIPK